MELARLLIRLLTWLQCVLTIPFRKKVKPADTAFLTRCLRSKGHLPAGISVKSVKHGDLTKWTSSVHRVEVDYTAPCDAPTAIIVKTIPQNFKGYLNSIRCGFWREAVAYDKLATDKSFGMPTIYYAYGSGVTGSMIILMEDLKANSTLTAYLLGNQGKEIPETDRTWPAHIGDTPPEDVVKSVFVQAARIHRARWNDPALRTNAFSFLKQHDWYSGKGKAKWEVGVECTKHAWQKFRNSPESKKVVENWNPAILSLLDNAHKQASWSKFQQDVKSRNFVTIGHGDWHAQNFFFKHDKQAFPRLFVVDWPEIGLTSFPGTDLAQTAVSDVPIELRRKHEIEWLKAYLEELGHPEYTFEQCLADYRAGLERWIVLFGICAGMGFPGNILQYFHDQVEAMWLDYCAEKKAKGEDPNQTFTIRTAYFYGV